LSFFGDGAGGILLGETSVRSCTLLGFSSSKSPGWHSVTSSQAFFNSARTYVKEGKSITKGKSAIKMKMTSLPHEFSCPVDSAEVSLPLDQL
jgi:uncharacterized protein YcnI